MSVLRSAFGLRRHAYPRRPWHGARRVGGAAEKRGAGAGWVRRRFPERFARLVVWMRGASASASTGAAQASEPSSSALHSSRVRVRMMAAVFLHLRQRFAFILINESARVPASSRSTA